MKKTFRHAGKAVKHHFKGKVEMKLQFTGTPLPKPVTQQAPPKPMIKAAPPKPPVVAVKPSIVASKPPSPVIKPPVSSAPKPATPTVVATKPPAVQQTPPKSAVQQAIPPKAIASQLYQGLFGQKCTQGDEYQPQLSLDKLKELATNLQDSGNYRKSLAKFQELITRFPDSFKDVFENIVSVCAFLHDEGSAMIYIERALLNPAIEKSIVFKAKGKFYCTLVTTIGGNTAEKTNDYQLKAIGAFEESIRLYQNCYENYISLSNVYRSRKEYGKMFDCIQTAEKYAKVPDVFYLAKANILYTAAVQMKQSGDIELYEKYMHEAKKSIEECVQINKVSSYPKILLCAMSVFEGNITQADIYYQEGLKLCGNNSLSRASVHYGYAIECVHKFPDKAMNLLEKCLEDNPEFTHAYLHVAKLHKAKGDYLKARAYVFEWLRRVPSKSYKDSWEFLNQINEILKDGNPQPEEVSVASTFLFRPTPLPSNQIVCGQPLSQGSFGAVYSGTYANIPVAIKCFANNADVNVFALEVTKMTYLRHPRIIQVYGFCIDNGTPKIIMECAEKSLNNILRDGSIVINGNVQLKISLDITYGLSYIHSKNMIHGDLKSHNILVNGTRAKICDFGLTRLRNRNDQTVLAAEAGGCTIRWAPPEIFSGERTDEDSDMYSYGVVLWELGARRTPLESFLDSQEISATMLHPEHKNRRQIENISQNTPPSMAILIGKCWETRREKRPTAKQAIEDIRENIPSFGF